MTMRSLDTRFWSDGWVRKINPLDRYLFLYLLTNDKTNWCGIYELDLGMMAFECGLDERDLERAFLPRLIPKVIYVDGWVYVPNFPKYHLNGTDATKKGYEKAFSQVPEKIRLRIKEIQETGVVPPSLPSSAFASAFAFTSTYPVDEVQEIPEEPKKSKSKTNAKEFTLFWEVFPNKSDKVSAFAEWAKLASEDKQSVLADVPNRVLTEAWTKEDGKYVPLAKTYLKNRRWEDEIKKPQVTMKF